MGYIASIGIVTAVPKEFKAVNEKLTLTQEQPIPDSPLFYKGDRGDFKLISTLCTDKGSICSLIATQSLIKNYNPDIIFLLGMAGGCGNDVRQNSVVFATEIIGYEYSKIIDRASRNAPRHYDIFETLKTLAHELGEQVVFPGIVACGSKVIASKSFKKKIQNVHKDICCLEMESEGAAAACRHANPRIPFVFLKGISDLADSVTKGEKDLNKERRDDTNQILATERAVEVFEIFIRTRRFRQFIEKPCENNYTVLPEKVSTISSGSELEFIRETKLDCIHFGNFDTKAQFFPQRLWQAEPRVDFLYQDNPEAELRLNIEFKKIEFDNNILTRLLAEADERVKSDVDLNQDNEIKNAIEIIRKGGSNKYPRLLGIPEITYPRTGNVKSLLTIRLGPSNYGLTLISEKKFNLPSADALRETHILNSLAVRIALVFIGDDGKKYCEFHQRSPDNSTYKYAWDVSAAGYIDPERHFQPGNTNLISPWQTAHLELSEELNIAKEKLPHRDKYFFFGIGRNRPTGQIDLLGYCEYGERFQIKRQNSKLVSAYDRCLLTPEAISKFIVEKKHWVPTAVITLYLTLEALGYPRERIITNFSKADGVLIDP
jgi:nucleoside phosphorylase